MKFFKKTMSYKLISFLERLQVTHTYFNIVLFMYNFIKFYFSIKFRILIKSSPGKKIELFFDMFKERFYLEDIRILYNLDNYSILNYNLINNNMICNINYGDTLKFYIEYDLSNTSYCIYITTKDKEFNLTEENLIKRKDLYELCNDCIKFLSLEIFVMLERIFYINIKKFIETNRKR